MPQRSAWEREYNQQTLVTGDASVQAFFLRYLRELKKKGVELPGLKVLDLGCGTGRNSNYLAERGAMVTGIDIATNAIATAKQRAKQLNLNVTYLVGSMADPYPCDDTSIDLVLDLTSSNSLSDEEREHYLAEVDRALKPGGHLFVRALSSEGKNVQNLLTMYPGDEPNTYIHPDIAVTERVFSDKEFRDLYSTRFKLLSVQRDIAYTRLRNQRYKRGFLYASMQKTG